MDNQLSAVEEIFNNGGIRNNHSPCFIEWLSVILKKGFWRVTPIPFVEILEGKHNGDCGFVYDCGYLQSCMGMGGFRGDFLPNHYENLHQAIHCLNKYRVVKFEDITTEYLGKRNWRIRAKNSEKTIVAQLGHLSYYDYEVSMSQFGELWFCSRKYFFYCLQKVREIPQEYSLDKFMRIFFNEKACCEGQEYNCGNHSLKISYRCEELNKVK